MIIKTFFLQTPLTVKRAKKHHFLAGQGQREMIHCARNLLDFLQVSSVSSPHISSARKLHISVSSTLESSVLKINRNKWDPCEVEVAVHFLNHLNFHI